MSPDGDVRDHVTTSLQVKIARYGWTEEDEAICQIYDCPIIVMSI